MAVNDFRVATPASENVTAGSSEQLSTVGGTNGSGTLAELTSLTRKEGNLYYATDTDILYADNGTDLIAIGPGGGGGGGTLVGLSDTPANYTGEGGKVLAVKGAEDGVEFITPAGGGGGSSTFTMPTAVADGVADAGKLMRADAGQALVQERIPEVLGTNWSWDVTIDSVGVAGTQSTFAWANFEFAGQPSDGDSVKVVVGPNEFTFEFTVDLPLNDPMAIPVNIGPALDVTLQELSQQIENFMQAPDLVKALPYDVADNPDMPPNVKVRVTAGDFIPGVSGNFTASLEILVGETDGSTNISLSHAGGVGEFTGGVDGVAGTWLRLDDFGVEGMGFINAQIDAGNGWAIQGNVNDEAAAIAVAMDNAFTDFDVNQYTTSVAANVITLTRGIVGGGVDEGGGDPDPEVSDSQVWSGNLATIDVFPGLVGSPETSQGIYIGKLVSVTGGVATIESQIINTFTADGIIANGERVMGGTDGTVRAKPEQEGQSTELGYALEGGADASQVLIKQFSQA